MSNLADKSKEQLIEEVEALRAELAGLKHRGEVSELKSDKLSRIILDEMYQFVALLDTQGNILEVNKTALTGAGITLEDIVHKPFWEAKWWQAYPEYQKKLQEAIKKARTGEFIRYEVEVYGGDAGKEIIWIDFSIIPVKPTSDQIVYLLAEGRNITEKKQAEAEVFRKNEQLRILYEKLKEFDELKSQFFANISHELRTPLALILGPIQQVLANQSLSQEEQQSLEVVERNARILLKQVNDLLDVAKLEAGKMEIRYAEADLSQMLRIIASNFESLAKEKMIAFGLDVPSAMPAEVDPEKMQRVILNLLSNAFKYTPAHGAIQCTLTVDAGKAILHVADSGPGVTKENRELIFERFRQLEGGSTRKFGGTGLGLAIVKDFLEMHQGSISVGDAPEGGALFAVEVPLKAPEHVQLHKSIIQEAGYVEDLTIPLLDEIRISHTSTLQTSDDASLPLVLVVEDNPDLNRFITQTLSDTNRVVAAMDGQEGLEKAVKLKPDLIISDIMMPRMSGDQLVDALRKQPEMDVTPIIMLTAKADEGLRLKMLSGGVQDYLLKPFSAEEVKARAKNLIVMKKAREVLQKELNSKNENLTELLSETIRIKQEQERTNIQLKQSNSDLDNFIYTASHDLRSPINNMEGLLHMLNKYFKEKNTVADKPIQDAMVMMDKMVLKLNQTTKELAEIAQAQREYLPEEQLNFKELLEEVQTILAPHIANSDAQIAADLAVESIRYPRKHLQSILYNLISNAIIYRSPDRAPLILVKTRQLADEVQLSVSDNGIGMEQQQQHKLFQMFTRLHKHAHGSGIGLYMVKRIIENNGGRISVESQKGIGTTFTVWFKKSE